MTHNLTRPVVRPAVHYYPIPDPTAALTRADPTDVAEYRRHLAELADRRRTDRILYTRWRQRQAQIAAQDRRNRRILLGIAVPLLLGTLGALGTVGWLLWHALAGINGPAVILLVLFVLAGLGGFGHRCITVVQHWH